MEGTEARIEKRERVWQQPSAAGSYNAVTQPAHYARFKIQPIEFILANGLNFLQASVIKYLVRYPYKNGMEDLMKCRNMLDRLIAEEQKVLDDLSSSKGKAYPIVGFVGHNDAEFAAQRPPGGLVWDARQEVGGQPASDHAEHGADRRDGTE